MNIIKRIIKWILYLLQKIFGIGKKRRKVSKGFPKGNINKQKMNNGKISGSLPDYMMISGEERLALINNIKKLSDELKKSNKHDYMVQKIIDLLQDGVNEIDKENDIKNIKNYLDNNKIISNKKIEGLLVNFDLATKDKVQELVHNSIHEVEKIENGLKNLDEILDYTMKNEISYGTFDAMNNYMDNLGDKKEENSYDKDIINTIKKWDKNIIDEIKLDYEKVNYVTISNVLIDKIIERYQKLEDDYRYHRQNKYYFEREINKLKEQINHLRTIKSTSLVNSEIEKLRKELYTKSKDKYDVLYNNEIFTNINKRCDELLEKVNQKVIDFKKVNEKEQKEDENERKKKEYLDKIIHRFQDLALSQQIILLYLEKQKEMMPDEDILTFVNKANIEFLNGINEPFNYNRNKTKTELVKFYNDLNMVISREKKVDFLSIDHINFQMSDLVDAIMVKKNEVNGILDKYSKQNNDDLVDEKMREIREKYIGVKDNKKVLKNNYNPQ